MKLAKRIALASLLAVVLAALCGTAFAKTGLKG